jgi:hypothetical protein
MKSLSAKKRIIVSTTPSDSIDEAEDPARVQVNPDAGSEGDAAQTAAANQGQPEKPFDPFFGFFDGWSVLEKYFFLILLMILFYQLHIFSFFHVGTRTLHAFDVMSADHGFAPGIDYETVDTRGLNWVPVYDRETQICMNLDSVIKLKGDVTPEERKQWKDFQCPDRLKGLYAQWYVVNNGIASFTAL